MLTNLENMQDLTTSTATISPKHDGGHVDMTNTVTETAIYVDAHISGTSTDKEHSTKYGVKYGSEDKTGTTTSLCHKLDLLHAKTNIINCGSRIK